MYFNKTKSGVTKIKRDTYGPDWFTISKEVKARDGYRCIFCGKSENPKLGVWHDVHHLKPLGHGGTTTKANLGTTCKDCHERRPGHKHMQRKGNGHSRTTDKTKIVSRPYVSKY